MADTSRVVEVIFKGKDEISGTLDHVSARLESLKSSIGRVASIGIGSLLGGLGVQGIDAATRGIKDLGAAMIDSNAQIELMKQRLNILYGNAAEGAQAFAFLKQNELIKPFNIEDILSASVSLVAFKQNITTLLPALENIAGAMGRSLPDAAQAFNAALSGRFQMLRYMGISRQMLIDAGAQINAGGHLTDPASLATAIENLGNTRFKGGADKLAQTWTGLMSSMQSQWFYFTSNLGQGAFSVLETQLHGIVHALQDPGNSAAIQNIELRIGAGLGMLTANAIKFGEAIGPYVGSAIALIARAWPLVEQGAGVAFGFVGSVVSSFAAWLQSTGFPAIEKVIVAIANAWIMIQPVVGRVLTNIGNDLSGFTGAVAGISAGLFQGLAGAFTIGMGAAQAIFGGALSLMSGNWAGFQNDINSGADLIVKGVVEMVGGMSIALLPVANLLMGPWTTAAQGIRTIFKDIGGVIGSLVGGLVTAMAQIDQAIAGSLNIAIGLINALIKSYDTVVGLIPGFGSKMKIGTIAPLQLSASPADIGGMASKQITDWFNQHAPGINANQTIHAGVSQAQAAADINARTAAILKSLGQGGTAIGTTYAAGQGIGADILAQIKGLFKDLGGKFTLSDLLAAFGLKSVSGGALAYTPPTGGLPVLGGVGGPAAIAAAGAGGIGTQHAVTGRVPLGALGATFSQTLATLVGNGTDPATRAAQKTADVSTSQYAEEQKHTLLLQQANKGTDDVVRHLEALTGAILKLVAPHPTPGSPLVHHAVGRPVF